MMMMLDSSHPLSEQSLIARAIEDRKRIFERYDQGRTKTDDIDPWEDPTFEIYHKTDKYGFIHDERLPPATAKSSSTAHLTASSGGGGNTTAAATAVQREREKKWHHMVQRWDAGLKPTDKLVARTYKGIPNNMRTAVWPRLLGAQASIDANPQVYERQLQLARAWSTEVRQIDSDVNRQFREHIFYRERYSLKQRSLFNVLTAYSMYNSELGYCQGMAGVAGMLLMYMDEEPAFWALNTLMTDPKYAMHGLFVEGFPKLQRFLAHHDRIVAKFLPKLHRHFARHQLDAILYALKWFFVVFVERVPFSLCLRVWDIYMIEGERVVTAMAFTILRMHATKLLKMKDMDQITELLQTQLHRDFGYADDVVVRTLQQTMKELRRVKMDLPPPPTEVERPTRPLGEFVEPDFEAKLGLRKSLFTDNERKTTETLIMRQDSMPNDVISNYSYDNSDEQMNGGLMVGSMGADDSSSLRSSSIAARASIASGCTTSAATMTNTYSGGGSGNVAAGGGGSGQLADNCSWSGDESQSCDGGNGDGSVHDMMLGPAEEEDGGFEMNQEIFLKTANEYMMLSPTHCVAPHNGTAGTTPTSTAVTVSP